MLTQEEKEAHHKLILNALSDKKMHSLFIAIKTKLSQHQVSRRMCELVRMGKVIKNGIVKVNRNGTLRGFTLYQKKESA